MGVTFAVVALSQPQLPDMGPSLRAEGQVLSGTHGPYQIAIALRQVPAQLLVSLRAEVPPLQRAQAMMGLLASVVQSCPALAVTWQASGVSVPVEKFLQLVPLLEEGPLVSLWVSFEVHEDSGRTIGLEDFGLMELETVNCPLGPAEAEEYMSGLAEYLLTQGSVVQDGDTLGEDERGVVRVVYSESAFANPNRVMRLVWAAA
jgi:hypothetical protein